MQVTERTAIRVLDKYRIIFPQNKESGLDAAVSVLASLRVSWLFPHVNNKQLPRLQTEE